MKHMLYELMLKGILFCVCLNQCSCITKIFLVKGIGPEAQTCMMEIISRGALLLICKEGRKIEGLAQKTGCVLGWAKKF